MQKRQRKAYTKEERKVQVIGAIAVHMQAGDDWWMTTAAIARLLHMSPSTHLRLILAEMVVDQRLDSRRVSDPGIAGFKRQYAIHDHNYRVHLSKARKQASMDEKRTIRVNSHQMSFAMEVN